ncbi:MAG: hypothetical protein OXG09_10955 [Chloroflexi bacterium]|nr:hypothetical protein [Chloroflexota bacterium]
MATESVPNFTDHPARVVRNINGLNVRRTPAIESDNILGRLLQMPRLHQAAAFLCLELTLCRVNIFVVQILRHALEDLIDLPQTCIGRYVNPNIHL